MLTLEDSAGVKQGSKIFRNYNALHWSLDTSVHVTLCSVIILRLIIRHCRHVRTHTKATLTVRQMQFNTNLAQLSVAFSPYKFSDDEVVSWKECMPSKMTVTYCR